MARGASWKSLWKSWRRPLLLPAFLLLIALTAAVLPPVRDSIEPELDALSLFGAEPEIRVLLSRKAPGQDFTFGGPSRARSGTERRVFEEGATAMWDGRDVVMDGSKFRPPVYLAPPKGEVIEIEGRLYHGGVELIVREGHLLIVNRVPLETYLAGVIAAEMGLHFPDEALKAQAIACRTYAIWRMRARASRPFDVGTTQATQVYRGVPASVERARRLVAATRGLVLCHEGRVLDALYSSTCGGSTRSATEAFGDAAPPPLAGVPCGHCNDAPRFKWTASIDRQAFTEAIGLDGLSSFEAPRFHRSGRLKEVTARSGSARRVVRAKTLRRAIGSEVYSPWMTSVALEGGRVVVTGRGFGHGVGLCQYGARGLARKRRSAREILAWYYPGARTATAW